MVTVIGEHLGVKGLMCAFGNAPEVSAESVSSSSIRCASPASERSEKVSFNVMDAGVEMWGFQGYFRYLEHIQVVGLQPSVGPVAGGAEVRVAGSGFRDGNEVTCHFGGAESAGEYVSASELMCRSPRRMEPANVTMSLSMVGIKVEGSEREFLYENGGVILAMVPRRGPGAGRRGAIAGSSCQGGPVGDAAGSKDSVRWLHDTVVCCFLQPVNREKRGYRAAHVHVGRGMEWNGNS